MLNLTYPDSTKAVYTYDKNGNRLSLSYLGNSASFKYDSRNRETSETWTIGGNQYTVSYSYDQVGNIASITYPDGTIVNYSTDAMDRATTIKTSSATLATINYRPDNRIANITYGNGVLTVYRYDKLGRTTEIKVVQGQTTLLDLAYGYDAVGNVVSIGSESYLYDFLNRLTSATGAWGTIKYGYDAVGNRLWLYQSPTNTTYTYGAYNRLTSVGSTTYTYDNNGNRITSTTGGTTTRYNYDFENRLTSVSQSSSTLGNYTYSPLRTRIQKVESGTTTIYVSSGVNVLYEKIGSTISNYVFTGSIILAKLTGSSMYYFHQDAVGSTRLVTTGSTTSFSSNYQPFGPQYGVSGTDPTYKYTAKPQDSATGLYYFGARYYEPSTGRFITRDPASDSRTDPQTSCRYSYARNNPEIITDPSGTCYVAYGSANYWGRWAVIAVAYSIVSLTICCSAWAMLSGPQTALGILAFTIGAIFTAAAFFLPQVPDIYWTIAFIFNLIAGVIRAFAPSWGWFSGVLNAAADIIVAVGAIIAGVRLMQTVAAVPGVSTSLLGGAALVFIGLWLAISWIVNNTFNMLGIACDPQPQSWGYHSPYGH